MKNLRIMLCGGGTGGHVLPLVAVARAIKKLNPTAKIYFVGPEEFSLNALREEGVIVKTIIAAGKIRRYFSFKNFWEIIKIPFAFIQSLIVVTSINPNVTLGKGSYGSVLPVLAADILFKKTIIHESDAIPGLANRFLSYVTDNVAISFEEARKYFNNKNVYLTGNPIRTNFINLSKGEASSVLDIQTDNPPSHKASEGQGKVIFISGGSQGAQRINNAVLKALDSLLEKYFVIWSVGKNNFDSIKQKISNKDNIKLFDFLNEKEIASAYILCDLAVGRAGAGTIFELAAFAKPSILIPLERKGGDQPVNAFSYTKTGASFLLRERDLDNFKETLENILNDDSKLDSMHENAEKFGKIEAADSLAKILLDLAKNES
ncbi:MAG: UDP-N-acetylglucosamine--N-acetylmuramyl-(pentapeptide) pyrophosphoryl-undecaprenol N-acetylglucosamine transferase [Patescibacteria group bacterium]